MDRQRRQITISRPSGPLSERTRRTERAVGEVIDVCELLADDGHMTPTQALVKLARESPEFKQARARLRRRRRTDGKAHTYRNKDGG